MIYFFTTHVTVSDMEGENNGSYVFIRSAGKR